LTPPPPLSGARVVFSLYKILFYIEAFVQESISFVRVRVLTRAPSLR